MVYADPLGVIKLKGKCLAAALLHISLTQVLKEGEIKAGLIHTTMKPSASNYDFWYKFLAPFNLHIIEHEWYNPNTGAELCSITFQMSDIIEKLYNETIDFKTLFES